MTAREQFDRLWPSLVALLGTVAVVVGLLFLFGGDDGGTADDAAADEAGATTAAPTGAATTTPENTTPAEPVTAPPEVRERVGILNDTDIAGLASQAQERLEAGGWEVPAIDTYTSGDVSETTVFYPEGMQEAAEALAAQFPEIAGVEPRLPNLTSDWLVLIVAEDYAEAIGAGG
ncbi:MAG: LytR C-terminal domain-containing protein [Jiangellaceae bacterium]